MSKWILVLGLACVSSSATGTATAEVIFECVTVGKAADPRGWIRTQKAHRTFL